MPKGQSEVNKWVKSSNGGPGRRRATPRHACGWPRYEPIYVARASHNGDLIPGKLVASYRCTYVSWGGLEFKKDEYEVLVGGSNNWIATSYFNVPSNALPGGKTDIGNTLYIVRVHLNECITTGKLQKSHGACYIPYEGKEIPFYHYEVLIY